MAPGGPEQVRFARLKALSYKSGDRSAGGRRFHVAGPLTAKLRVFATRLTYAINEFEFDCCSV